MINWWNLLLQIKLRLILQQIQVRTSYDHQESKHHRNSAQQYFSPLCCPFPSSKETKSNQRLGIWSPMLQGGESIIKKKTKTQAGYVRIVLYRFGVFSLKHLALAIETDFWTTFLWSSMASLAFAFILCVFCFSVSLFVRDTVKASCVYGMSAKPTSFLGGENWPQALNVQRLSQNSSDD